MCTLIVLDRVVPGLPLVVASNRDEYFSRPAAPPSRVKSEEEGHPAFVAPQDLEMGGTWMGLNALGLFVGLTNRRTVALQTNRRSRGLLVRDALRRHSARAVAEDMREGLEGIYNPLHLLYADTKESFLTCLHEDGVETRALHPGVHVVGNRDPRDPSGSKASRTQEAVERMNIRGPFEVLFGELVGVLSSHDGGESPLEDVCVHTPAYGTRSSTILALGEDRWRYWHAEGPPCQVKYRDCTHLLDELRQA